MNEKLQALNNLISISPSFRREFILKEMESLKAKDVNCFQCRGPCCTFEANSMQITPLETIDIINYLYVENRISPDLLLHLQETIMNFRLNLFIGTGKTAIRKTYTCPFFENGVKGCSISRNSKPVGCLGFNPVEKNIVNGGTCKSDLDLLLKRDDKFKDIENDINLNLKNSLNIIWDKAPIPIAVFDVLLSLEIEF